MDVRLEVLRLLLDTGEDLSVHEIARRLHMPPSQVFYHLKKLVSMGVLVREEEGDRVYYSPQPLFTNGLDETIDKLAEISDQIVDADDFKTANCLYYFLQLYEVLKNSLTQP